MTDRSLAMATTRATERSTVCFLCGRAFRAVHGEPINGGEGVELCRPCGAIYEHPELCC